MKIITKAKIQGIKCPVILILLLMLHCNHGILTDNLYSIQTPLIVNNSESDSHSFRHCLNCRGNMFNRIFLPTHFQPEDEDASYEKESTPEYQSDNYGHITNHITNSIWNKPQPMGKSNDLEVVRLPPAEGNIWSEIQLQQREKKSSEHIQPESIGLWFGPRLGRRDKKSGDIQLQPVKSSMWFGPRLGRKEKQSSDGKVKSAQNEIQFGSQLKQGKRKPNDKKLQPDAVRSGKWSESQLEQKENKSSNSKFMQQEPATGSMWLAPQSGLQEKKSYDRKYEQNFKFKEIPSTGIGRWLKTQVGEREKKSQSGELINLQGFTKGGMWFGPRLGRREKKSNIKLQPTISGMWFGPRLGRREKKATNEDFMYPGSGNEGKWFTSQSKNLETVHNGRILENPMDDETEDGPVHQGSDTWLDSQFKFRGKKSSNSEKSSVTTVTDDELTNEIQVEDSGKKSPYDNANLYDDDYIWTHVTVRDDTPPDYEFIPRLGRHLPNSEDSHMDHGKLIKPVSNNFNTETVDVSSVSNSSEINGAHLNQRARKANKVFAHIPQRIPLWTILAATDDDDNDKPPQYDFTPRLGRTLDATSSSATSINVRSPPSRYRTRTKYGYFTPRLGRNLI